MLKEGSLFVISAPSGAGKTTLCQGIRKIIPDLKYSVSYTTRQPRLGEKNGLDYCFVSQDKFKEMISNGEFIEWAEVHGNFYGTSKKIIDEETKNGADIILDIDPQGAKQIKGKLEAAVFIFILPPSLADLEKRLVKRNLDTDQEIKKRLEKAKEEIKSLYDYHYLIINETLDDSLKRLESIIIAEKCKLSRFNINNLLTL